MSNKISSSKLNAKENYLSRGLQPNFNVKWIDGENEFINIFGISERVIDFSSGILVNCLGYKNKNLTRKLNSLINKGIIHSYHYQTSIKEKYLKSLYKFTSDIIESPKFYLTSSGTEATETCMKLMLRHGNIFKKKRNKILTIEGNYHGRTMGSSLMSNGSIYKEVWPEIDIFFPKIRFPYKWEVEEDNGADFFHNEINKLQKNSIDSICGILIETYQGWGACTYPKSFIKTIEKFCKDKNIIFAFDEMQSGFFRTGHKFGFEHYDVKPDMICIGKGMGGGYPLSGIAGKEEIMDLALPGELSSTHSCNPMACTAGDTVIEIMEDAQFKFLLHENCKVFSDRSKKLINMFDFLKSKSSFIGMVGALVFDLKDNSTEVANRFCSKALEAGVLVIKTGRESVKLSPPLVISRESLDKAFDIFEYILRNEI